MIFPVLVLWMRMLAVSPLTGAKPEIGRSLKRPLVKILGSGEACKTLSGAHVDLTYSAGRASGAAAKTLISRGSLPRVGCETGGGDYQPAVLTACARQRGEDSFDY
ncbi:hypothetical protein [Novosphingopyxis sp. YJ-S2-01]|uniref:hypothetical protein n=1 Tax=Novosphingopyxis sp. YJ-S2-01 TaxID=2794021 RepID=UPI0018DBEDEB|nr:hypothetical protein [Novosphingopyxis sp. YJ-S2-01]MBH9537423.1 hypothetical protein [Novosphingopyxis sp. YJ-S2-01]|tara:strand:- start:47 stop:364 length:318 start_codon:yes stop_codon:yes gene_type:complete